MKRRETMIAFIEKFMNHVIPSPKILDVGCGDGWYTSFLVTRSDSVIGIDMSNESLKKAKRNAKKADFVLCNANTTPFADNVFDLAIAAQFLEHMNRPALTVRNLTSLVKNGGFLLFELPSSSNAIDYFLAKLLRRKSRWGLTTDPSHKHFFGQNELERLFGECELRIICISGVVHFRYSLPLISRLVWDRRRRFWPLLEFFDRVLGMIKKEWGSIQIYLLQRK